MAGDTPMRSAMASIVIQGDAINAAAASLSSSLIARGRPPIRPGDRVWSRPALVRSASSTRSSSPSAPKIWKTSFPSGVEVLGQASKPDLTTVQFFHRIDELTHRPRKAIELPHHQYV